MNDDRVSVERTIAADDVSSSRRVPLRSCWATPERRTFQPIKTMITLVSTLVMMKNGALSTP